MEQSDSSWQKNYKLLERLMGALESANEENLQSFHSAIEKARVVESKAVQYLTQVTGKISTWKNQISNLRYQLKLKRKEILLSEAYQYHQKSENRKDYIEVQTADIELQAIEAQAKLDRLLLFREAILKVISAAKNSRSDISKKLKVVEIQYNINEIEGGAHHAGF